MLVSEVGHFATTGRALDKAFLDEKRFVDLLQRAGVFTQRSGDGGQSDRTSAKLVDNGAQNLVVYLIQPVTVDIKRLKGEAGYLRLPPRRKARARYAPNAG